MIKEKIKKINAQDVIDEKEKNKKVVVDKYQDKIKQIRNNTRKNYSQETLETLEAIVDLINNFINDVEKI